MTIISQGLSYAKNRLPTNMAVGNKLLKTFQTPNMSAAQNIINVDCNLLKMFQTVNMQSAQILSASLSYSQKKKDSGQAVLIQRYTRLPNNIGLPDYIELVKYNHLNDVHEVQPLGSIPRLSNSLRRRRLTHPDLLSSPSSFMAMAKRSDSSLSSLNCITWRSLFSFVDIVNSYGLTCNRVDNVLHCMTFCKAMPRSVVALTGHLITNDRVIIEVTMYKSNQTHTKITPPPLTKFLVDDKPVKNRLPLLVDFGYSDFAPHKTGVRIGTLNILKATHDAPSVFFCVQTKRINAPYSHSMVWCVPLITVVKPRYSQWNTLHRPSMVALAGQPSGWLVSFSASSSNPVNVTTLSEIGTSGGDSLNKLKEIIL